MLGTWLHLAHSRGTPAMQICLRMMNYLGHYTVSCCCVGEIDWLEWARQRMKTMRAKTRMSMSPLTCPPPAEPCFSPKRHPRHPTHCQQQPTSACSFHLPSASFSLSPALARSRPSGTRGHPSHGPSWPISLSVCRSVAVAAVTLLAADMFSQRSPTWAGSVASGQVLLLALPMALDLLGTHTHSSDQPLHASF